MQVRCERCSAVYELDERALPPAGAPVQCTRCQHVFQAFPPQAPGRTLPMFPAVQGGAPAEPAAPAGAPPPAGTQAPPAGGSGPTALWPAASAAAAAPARAPPAPPAQPGAPARRGRAGTAIPSARGPWRWLGPLLAVLAVGAGAGLWWHRSARIDPAAKARWLEGLQILERDDDRSLEEAARLMGKAAALDPRLFQARADRALALTLLAADERERVAQTEAALHELEAERSGPETEGAEGWRERQAQLIGRMKPLQGEIATIRARVAQITAEASTELEALGRMQGGDPSVARALAVHHAFAGEREQASRVINEARAAGLSDPWLDLAEGASDLAAGSEPARRQAVARLAALAAAHPGLLRASMLLARAEADLGDTGAAVAGLDRVLAANPGHDLARRTKERLLRPPPADSPRPPVPLEASPPGPEGPLPRKAVAP